MKIRTALALAALAVTPAFAAEPAAPTTDEAMTSVEKSTVDSLQKEIAMLQQAVDQVRKASTERQLIQAQRELEQNSHQLWP